MEIMKQLPEMRNRQKDIEAKNALLATFSRSFSSRSTLAPPPPLVDVHEVASDWDALIAALTAHEDNLERQKGDLGRQVEDNVSRFQIHIEALRGRWLEIKPTGALRF
jgi:hypothetical protein